MTRDYGQEIDELKADQEALRAEWAEAKDKVRHGAQEIKHISDRLNEIADEMTAAVHG